MLSNNRKNNTFFAWVMAWPVSKISALLLVVASLTVTAQPYEEGIEGINLDDYEIMELGLVGNDTVLMMDLMEVPIVSSRIMTDEEIRAYRKLKRNIIKVYPYAQRAIGIINEINSTSDAFDKNKDRRKYRNRMEDYLKTEFKDELKKLTVSQGKVLVKLIERETGEPFYEVIKDNKSGVTAFFWHNMSKSFGYDLKEGYDPEEYKDMEEIVIYLEEHGVEYFGYREFPTAKKVEDYGNLPSANVLLDKKNKKPKE